MNVYTITCGVRLPPAFTLDLVVISSSPLHLGPDRRSCLLTRESVAVRLTGFSGPELVMGGQ
jgi:hypothetical protein